MRGVGNKAKKAKKRSTNDKEKKEPVVKTDQSRLVYPLNLDGEANWAFRSLFGLFDHWMKGKCRFFAFLAMGAYDRPQALFSSSFVSAELAGAEIWA